MTENILSTVEYAVISTVVLERENAYGVPIRKKVSKMLNRNISVGQLYTTLGRLEHRGFLKSKESGATKERGGRKKRYYVICAPGISALSATKEVTMGIGLELDAVSAW